MFLFLFTVRDTSYSLMNTNDVSLFLSHAKISHLALIERTKCLLIKWIWRLTPADFPSTYPLKPLISLLTIFSHFNFV